MGFLDPYRVLDLTDERGLLAGRILADLGADVVQVEPPGGSTARRVPPFAFGASLFWAAFAANKRGIVCDLETPAGQARIQRLLATADVLLESFTPGEMERLGLSRERVREQHPGLVHVSITAFGSDGPKAGLPDTDIVVWAAGGALYPNREDDLPPLRISVPQAFLHASADAAGAALIALAARARSGCGQHVDVSAQASVAQATLSMVLAAQVSEHIDLMSPFVLPGGADARRLDLSGSGSRTRRSKWVLRDGLAELHLAMGPAAGGQTNALFAWIDEAGACDADTAALDWRTIPARLADGSLSSRDLEHAREVVADFLAGRTKEEIVEEAMRRKLALAPVYTVGDLAESTQLHARGYWRAVRVAGREGRAPGRFARTTSDAFVIAREAPGHGEHDEAVPDRPVRLPIPTAAGRDAAPFEDLRVVDLSWVVAGPVVGRTLADYGATVVRVESARRIDLARLVGPHADGLELPESSACFANVNAGKLGIAVDLSSEDGRDVVRDLVRWGSVVVESFSPGVMERWGLGYEALAQIDPSVILLSTSLMGHTGPYSSFAGSGNVGAALAGFQGLAGWPGRVPFGPYGPYTDYVGPRFSLIALLAALDHRARTGEGGHLDVAQAEAGIQFLAPEILDATLTGRVAGPRGNGDPQMAPHGVYPCRDSADGEPAWIAIAARSDEDWRALAPLIAAPEGLTGAGTAERLARAAEIDALVGAWSAGITAAKAERALWDAGVPAHRAASPRDAANDEQLRHRGHFVDVPHPQGGTITVESSRFRLSGTPAQVRRAGPTIGQDTDRVLSELLGYNEARIARLQAAGVLR
jgi:crotonobetainyl-CoA:carnitine CoA-transferase CaiB-like acyl-CoA transferase